MDRTVKCPHCGQVQHAIIIRDGRLYAADDDNVGSEITGYRCPNCDQVIHWGVRKALPAKRKILAR